LTSSDGDVVLTALAAGRSTFIPVADGERSVAFRATGTSGTVTAHLTFAVGDSITVLTIDSAAVINPWVLTDAGGVVPANRSSRASTSRRIRPHRHLADAAGLADTHHLHVSHGTGRSRRTWKATRRLEGRVSTLRRPVACPYSATPAHDREHRGVRRESRTVILLDAAGGRLVFGHHPVALPECCIREGDPAVAPL
jgi:hypothetical protein